ncbi:MAG TPA: hypothetical protein VKR59_02405 [Terriglobales bacterium]|nr:hypothetical protein [Terriglobales bacterium]
MKRSAALMALLMVLLVNCHSAQAKCLSVLVRVDGDIVAAAHEGDVVLLKFTCSPKRVETSSPQPPNGQTFILVGAYSSFKRRDVFKADVCGAAPRQTDLVLADKNGKTLDTVGLTTPDERAVDAQVSYGKKQIVVVHRTPSFP